MRQEKNSYIIECLAFVVLAAIFRLDFLIASDFVIDSDEAIVGLMGKHIMEGKNFPIFYYGQSYMGSLEAICAAISFSLFGISSAALKLVPFLWSLALVAINYFCVKKFLNINAARISSLLLAVASNGFLTWSVMARGGFIEIVVIGLLSLFALAWWLQDQLSLKRAFLAGLLLGLGWWTNNQIVFFFLSAAIVALYILCKHQKQGTKTIGFSALGFLIGSFPFWLYNIKNGFASSSLFGLAKSSEISDHFLGLLDHSIPILFGGQRFWSENDLFSYSSIIIDVLIWFPVAIAIYRAIAKRTLSIQVLALLVIPWSFLLFSVSKYGFLYVAPRYLLPIVPVIYLLIADEITNWTCIKLKSFWIGSLLLMNILSLYMGGRGIPGQPFIYGNDRATKDHTQLINLLTEKNITKLRTNYWLGYRVAFETEEKVTFKSIGEPQDNRMPEYYEGINDLTPLLLSPTQVRQTVAALEAQGRSFSYQHTPGYTLIYDISEPSCGDNTKPTKISKSEATNHKENLKLLFDKDLTTRWGSGAPQNSEMKIEIWTAGNVNWTRKLSWSYGPYKSDYPRVLQILAEVSSKKGNKPQPQEVLSDKGYKGLRLLYGDMPEESFVCLPSRTTRVQLNQLGQDPIYDWSFAELSIYE